MTGRWGRDAELGDVWLPDPDITHIAGPERIADEKPPKRWKPRPLLGFSAGVGAEVEEEADD
jgi:hypothetical protein